MKKRTRNKRVNLFEKSISEMKHALDTFTKKELQYELDHFHDSRQWNSQDEKELATPLLHLNDPDHKKPVTRRDFLGRGLIAGGVSFAMPTLSNLLFADQAQAQAIQCAKADTTGEIVSVITLDLAGGNCLLGKDVIVGREEDPSKFLEHYRGYGVPDDIHPSSNNEAVMGTLFHSQSVFLAGIRERASAEAIANTNLVPICHQCNDDTANVPQNIGMALAKAGLSGQVAPTIGTSTTASGGRQAGCLEENAFRASQVRNLNQAVALQEAGPMGQVLNQAQRDMLVTEISRFNLNQALNMPRVLASTRVNLGCGALQAHSNLMNNRINPVEDLNLLDVMGDGNPGTGENRLRSGTFDDANPQSALGMALYLTSNGWTGPATLALGGYDYHGNTPAQRDTRDRNVGRIVGYALEYWHRTGTPGVMVIETDGSVSHNTNNNGSAFFAPQGDRSSQQSSLIIAYDPSGQVRSVKKQIGLVGTNGIIPSGTAFESNPMLAGQVKTANVLALAGKLDQFSRVFSNSPINLNDVVAFSGKLKRRT